jgi:hypothetical protein
MLYALCFCGVFVLVATPTGGFGVYYVLGTARLI